MLRLPGPPGILSGIADTAAEHVHRFDAGNLAIASWALAMLGMSNERLLDLALDRVAKSFQNIFLSFCCICMFDIF